MTPALDSTLPDPAADSCPGAAPRSVIEQLGQALSAATEPEAWDQVAEFTRRHFGGDTSACMEFLGDERATLRSSKGLTRMADNVEFAVTSDSQAAYTKSSTQVCASSGIIIDARFEAGGLLTYEGLQSSLTAPFTLANGSSALLGVHSRTPGRFAHADHMTLAVLANLLGTTIDRIRYQRALEVRARTDLVTGLDNRSAILGDLEARLKDGRTVTAILIDLDGFKSVNDQHGHLFGDRVLQVIARRVSRSLGPNDHLGRLGGDEFLVLVNGRAEPSLAEKILGHVEEIIMIEARTIGVSASIGMSSSHAGDSATALLDRADRKMYSAKALGRGHVMADPPFEPTVRADAEAIAERPHVDLGVVDHAIANLSIAVQPIIEATTGNLSGAEALTRGPRDSPLEFPNELFNAATTLGRLGELELASKRLAFDLDLAPDVTLFINLEPSLLCDSSWFDELAQAWNSSGSNRPVVAEITERSVMDHPGRLLDAVAACRRLGWQIALDDVGSRSESLAALRWVEPDIVKLDMSLIRNENPAHSAHVVAAIAAYRSHSPHQSTVVIAEGVESKADENLADTLGADLLQGFGYGRPGPVVDLSSCTDLFTPPDVSRPIPYLGDRVGSKADLMSMSRHIEAAAVSADCIILSTIQDVRNFTRRTRRQYRAMARRCGFVGVLGADVTTVVPSEVTGVRLADLEPGDPLLLSWQVLAMSPTMSLGLLATELPEDPGKQIDDADRLFRYRFINSPSEVDSAVRRLLHYF